MTALLPCPNPMPHDFAEELRERLLLIADSEHLRGKHTLFGGEIREMGRLVRTAALCLGRPVEPPPPETPTSGPDCDGEAGQCAMSAREDKSPLRIVSGVEERLREALKPFAQWCEEHNFGFLGARPDDHSVRPNGLTMGDFRRAAEALSPPALVEGRQEDQELTVSGAGAESVGFAARTDAPHSAGKSG